MKTTDLSSRYVSNGRNLETSIDPGHNASSGQAFRIGFQSFATISASARPTEAQCDLTTTHIEASVFCNTTGSCAVGAVRDSNLDHLESINSAPDSNNAGSNDAKGLFSGFVIATTTPNEDIHTSSAIENYIANPSSPFKLTPQATALADLDDGLFSR